MSRGQIAAVYKMLWILSRLDDDYAKEINGVGFSKFDSVKGHSLAVKARECGLHTGELRTAIRLLRKYRRQINPNLYHKVYPEGTGKESINLRLDPKVKTRLNDIAGEHRCTLAEMVDFMLRAAIAAYDKAQNDTSSPPADGPGSPGPIRPVA